MLIDHDDTNTMRAAWKAGLTFFLTRPPELSQLIGLLRCPHDAMLREKRSHVRLPLRTVVTCELRGHRLTCASRDISEEGMWTESAGGLTVGDEVMLLFSVPQAPGMLNPRAVVVRKDAHCIALRFVSPAAEDRKAIQDYIAGKLRE